MVCVRFPASQLPLHRAVRGKGGSGLGAREDGFSSLMGLENDTGHQVSLYFKPENRQAATELPKDFFRVMRAPSAGWDLSCHAFSCRAGLEILLTLES